MEKGKEKGGFSLGELMNMAQHGVPEEFAAGIQPDG